MPLIIGLPPQTLGSLATWGCKIPGAGLDILDSLFNSIIAKDRSGVKRKMGGLDVPAYVARQFGISTG